MKTLYSVAEARNEWAEIVNTVAYSGAVVTVEKYGKPIVKVIPVVKKDSSAVDRWAGIWKNKKWAAKVGKPSRIFRNRDYAS